MFYPFTLQLFAYHIVEICVTFLQIWQKGLLQEEIRNLKDGINNLNNHIESWKSESGKLEAALANIHNQYNNKTKERDVLQEKRKYVNFLLTVIIEYVLH